jgi:hypothetical protein
MQKDLWREDRAVTVLPKTKIMKIKAAKIEKKDAEPKEGAVAAAPAEAKGEAKEKVKKV